MQFSDLQMFLFVFMFLPLLLQSFNAVPQIEARSVEEISDKTTESGNIEFDKESQDEEEEGEEGQDASVILTFIEAGQLSAIEQKVTMVQENQEKNELVARHFLEEITDQRKVIEDLRKEITDLRKQIAEQKQVIDDQETELREQRKVIEDQRKVVDDERQQVVDQEHEIKKQGGLIKELVKDSPKH